MHELFKAMCECGRMWAWIERELQRGSFDASTDEMKDIVIESTDRLLIRSIVWISFSIYLSLRYRCYFFWISSFHPFHSSLFSVSFSLWHPLDW
jgi:hypothetical protein